MLKFERVRRLEKALRGKKLFLLSFVLVHFIFSYLLGNFYGFAPDESGYIYTLDNLYGVSKDANPQLGSGWITTSKPFLWMIYLPAKIMMLFGLPDYIAIRLFTIIASLFTLILLLYMVEKNRKGIFKSISVPRTFYFFYIPSIFMWQSLGLRDALIILELTAIAAGISVYIQNGKISNLVLVVLGSYGLLSTKNYQWLFLVIAFGISISILILFQRFQKKHLTILLVTIILPALLYTSTTSFYALGFFLRGNITETAHRSGDSVSVIEVPKSANPSTDGANPSTDGANPSTSNNSQKIFVHGDSTVVSLYRQLQNSPKSTLSAILLASGISKFIAHKYYDLVKNAEKEESKNVLVQNSPHILKPGFIHSPPSLFRASFNFLFGPIPFFGGGGIFLQLLSFESPIWWLLGILLSVSIIRAKKRKLILQNFECLVFGSYLIIVIVTSAMVEVNLGTSFRHRSLILVPTLILINFFQELRLQSQKIEIT